jgi:hypothetical protein
MGLQPERPSTDTLSGFLRNRRTSPIGQRSNEPASVSVRTFAPRMISSLPRAGRRFQSANLLTVGEENAHSRSGERARLPAF